MLSLTRVRIVDPTLSAIEAQLKTLARHMGAVVQGMPVVLESDLPVDLRPVLVAMRDIGLQPLAVMEGPLEASARACGLSVLPGDVLAEASGRGGKTAEMPPAPSAPGATIVGKSARIVSEPVRSGQQIYAEGSDLILLNAVSTGAEVIADGCVHVYGVLRGRAIAGARGDQTARVLMRKLEADLIAVAGVYAVAEQIPAALRGAPAQALLRDGKLCIERLEL